MPQMAATMVMSSATPSLARPSGNKNVPTAAFILLTAVPKPRHQARLVAFARLSFDGVLPTLRRKLRRIRSVLPNPQERAIS